VAKAVLIALRRNPGLNAKWDEANQEIVQFNYVNLGIAAATPRGLTVPNIKDADRLALIDLSTALAELTDTARAGKTSPGDLSGGTISITNIGVFGIDAGTPILNPGEAAILAMGAVRKTPWEYQDQVALRQVMTLSLSFDHRLVDGEQGSRFLADVGALLADPGMALRWPSRGTGCLPLTLRAAGGRHLFVCGDLRGGTLRTIFGGRPSTACPRQSPPGAQAWSRGGRPRLAERLGLCQQRRQGHVLQQRPRAT
jgi:hypothetical protein